MRGGKFLRQFTGTKIRGAKGIDRNAPAQGTLRAWKKKNQTSRTQFRAKSGVATAIEDEIVVEEIMPAGASGSVHVIAVKAGRSEIWFC